MPEPAARDTRRAVWIAAGLVALVVAVFGQVADHELVDADDYAFVAGRVDPGGTAAKPNIRDGLTWPNVVDAFHSYYFFMPLPTLSIELNHSISGDAPAGFLLGNVLLHALSTLVLFGWLRAATGETTRSAFVAAIFAIHPLNVEPVAWATCRKDTLATLFSMLALAAYTRWSRRPGASWAVAVVAALIAGMLSKSVVVMLPAVILLLDFWPLRRLECGPHGLPSIRSAAKSIAWKLPLFAVAIAMALVTVGQYGAAGNLQGTDSVPIPLRLLGAIDAYGWYLAKAVWPSGLAIYQPHIGGSFIPTQAPPIARIVVSALGLVAISAYALVRARTRPVLLTGWLWFGIVLLPMVGLVQVYTGATASRYMYLPGVGLAIAIVWEVADRVRNARAAGVIGGLVVAALAVASFQQVGTWRNSQTLFRHAVAVTDDNWFAFEGLAKLALQAGGPDAAEADYREVFRIRPRWTRPRGLYGLDLLEVQRNEEAAVNIRYALARFPQSAQLRRALAVAERRLADSGAERALMDPTR